MIAVGAFRKAMRDIAAKKGDFTLFALFKRENGLGNWDLVVSAPWLDGSVEATRKLVNLVVKSIGRKHLLQLARVETLFGHDPAVKRVIKKFSTDEGERRVEGPIELFGLEMDDAIFLRAKLPERKKAVRKAPRATVAGTARAQR